MGKCAPTLVRLRTEFNNAFPGRHSELGCCPGAAHSRANPTSDHEPNAAGWCRARDFGEGIDHGLKPFVDYVMANPAKYPQVKYLIYERVIYYPSPGKRAAGAYAYTGPNPHATHLHVSIHDAFIHHGGSWYVAEAFQKRNDPKAQPAPLPQEEDLMAKAFIYNNQLAVFTVDGPDIRQRFFDPVSGKWTPTPIQIATGVEDGAEIAIVRDYLGDKGRLDLFADGDPGGVVHAWYSPKYGWDREVLT